MYKDLQSFILLEYVPALPNQYRFHLHVYWNFFHDHLSSRSQTLELAVYLCSYLQSHHILTAASTKPEEPESGLDKSGAQ